MDLEALSQPYEVRCHRCKCSFAPGTRQCLHCGGKLGPPRELSPVSRRAAPFPGEEQGEAQVPSLARAVLWVLSVALAIGLSALQTCRG